MKNLQDVTERVCELKGNLVAIDALLPALLEALPPAAHGTLVQSFDAHAEAARTILLHAPISDHVLAAFESGISRTRSALAALEPPPPAVEPGAVEALLLTATRVRTFQGQRPLSDASGFFFRREGRLFLVTSRHVLADELNVHFPDRVEIELHVDPDDLTRYAVFSVPLYDSGVKAWREVADQGGAVDDVAAIEIDPGQLPDCSVVQAFEPAHLDGQGEPVRVGDALSVVGFPLGFEDTVHHLPVVRGACVASAYGVRFQQQGCFLTDGRADQGSRGAPVLRRRAGRAGGGALPWQLLGVHSGRSGMSAGEPGTEASLGLHCAWYADVLMALTDPVQ